MSKSSRSPSRLHWLAVAAGLAFLPACAAAAPPPSATGTPSAAPAAAAAASPATPPAVTGPYDVIIVGAGLSGLAAARELRHLHPGFKLLVLEATGRVGGRGYTHEMASGTPIDLGGAWVHGVPTNPLTSLVDRLGFTRVKTDLTTPFYTSSGPASAAENEQLHQAIEHFEERVQAGALLVQAASASPASPVVPAQARAAGGPGHDAPKCQQHPTGDRASDYLPCGYERYHDLIRGNSGPLESTAELDATSAVDASDFAAGEDDLVTQGLGEVVKAFGLEMIDDAKAPLAVRLEAPVTAVGYGDRGVTVTTREHGSPHTYEARRVLVTVSTGVLQRDPKSGGIAFDPPLPAKKRDAIAGLPMGLMNKIIFEFAGDAFDDKVPANSWVLYQGDAPDDHGHKEVTAFALRPFGSKRIAVGFVGGDRARSLEKGCQRFVDDGTLLPEDPRPHPCDAPAIGAARDALGRMFPASAGRDAQVYVTRWGLVSWTRGAYSAALPGKSAMHEELGKPVPFPTALYDEEKKRHGDARGEAERAREKERRYRVFFAGEGCARPIHNGSFPGAYESGLAAARALSNSLEADPPAR